MKVKADRLKLKPRVRVDKETLKRKKGKKAIRAHAAF